jgi:hypothetical protein
MNGIYHVPLPTCMPYLIVTCGWQLGCLADEPLILATAPLGLWPCIICDTADCYVPILDHDCRSSYSIL